MMSGTICLQTILRYDILFLTKFSNLEVISWKHPWTHSLNFNSSNNAKLTFWSEPWTHSLNSTGFENALSFYCINRCVLMSGTTFLQTVPCLEVLFFTKLFNLKSMSSYDLPGYTLSLPPIFQNLRPMNWVTFVSPSLTSSNFTLRESCTSKDSSFDVEPLCTQ